MNRFSKIIGAVLLAAGTLSAGSAFAAGASTGPDPELQDWSFAGIFGKYDPNQLQRGFQVFQESCSSCHSANLFKLRMLSGRGGPGYTEDQVKALAAEFTIEDPEAADGERKGIPADAWPNPWASPQDAKDANNGVVPPDFSVLAKARNVPQKFPNWIGNYFTVYQEGGADYIYNILTGYHEEAPHGFELGDGQYYNDYFPGHAISMAPPLSDELIDYEGDAPETVEQYAKDVAAFMMWLAEPDMNARKELGFRVLLFLILFAGMMYLVKRRLWDAVDH